MIDWAFYGAGHCCLELHYFLSRVWCTAEVPMGLAEERRLLRGSVFRSVVSLVLCLGGEAVICWGWVRLIRRCASLPVVCSLGRVVVTVGAFGGRLVFFYKGRLH